MEIYEDQVISRLQAFNENNNIEDGFSLSTVAQTYWRSRIELADLILTLAGDHDYKFLLEEGLKHQLEVLRMSFHDYSNIRYSMSLALLGLNRDDDCYGFIKWWLIYDLNGADEAEQPSARSKEGEWMYLKDQNRLEDLFVAVPELKPSQIDLYFLLALAIIKLRLSALYSQQDIQFQTFLSTNRIEAPDINDRIRDYFMGTEKYLQELRLQDVLADKYLRIIDQKNKTILRAIANPNRMLYQLPPDTCKPGSIEEAFFALRNCLHHFERTPNAIMKIEAIVGKKPRYKSLS